MAMDTDSNADEEGAEESRDGPSPGRTLEEAALSCAPAHAISAPCSPTGSRPTPGPGSSLDCASVQKASERPSSLPPSSPRALSNNDWAYHSTVCPAERQNPGMHKDKGIICMLYLFRASSLDMKETGGGVLVDKHLMIEASQLGYRYSSSTFYSAVLKWHHVVFLVFIDTVHPVGLVVQDWM